MHAAELIEQVRKAKAEFGATCSKLAGSVAVEILRIALLQEGIPISRRDCFVRGLPIEVDLLVTRPGARPTWELVYGPDEVCVALEVKQVGAFPGTIEKVRRDFGRLSAVRPHITCAYVAIEERRGYKGAVSEANIDHRAFTLATYQHPAKSFELTGEWERLVAFLRERVGG
jgi:hypothetical protein